MESVERRRRPVVPEIYKKISEAAPIADIEAQMHADEGPGEDAGERLILGFQELLMREEEGRRAIERLTKGDGRVARAAAQILEEDIDTHETGRIEKVLGINRWSNTLLVTEESFEKVDARIQERIRERGYSDKSMAEIAEFRRESDERGLNPHLDELIEQEVLTTSATFGSAEIVYLELVGAREILRLRDQSHGRFLLMGSYGKYSAQYFDAYAKKIHPAIDTHVIDIDPESVEKIAASKSEEQTLTQADARMLPFAPESFDHVYTNNLFHFLRTNGFFRTMRTKWDISAVLREVHAALKPGGSFIIQEQPYGRFRKGDRSFDMKLDIAKRAADAGYAELMFFDRGLSYALVEEAGSATIDANGFAHYGDALIFDDGVGTGYSQMRFVKRS